MRKSFKKKKDAEAELGKRVSLIAEGRYLDVKKEYTTTLKKILDEYEKNHEDQRSYQTSKKYFIADIRNYFGNESLLKNIRYIELETFRNYLKTKLTKGGTIDQTVICGLTGRNFKARQFNSTIKESPVRDVVGSVVTWSFLPDMSGLKISFANQRPM